MKRRAAALAALGFVAVSLAGCGGSGKPSIVLYDGQHPQLTEALVAAFEKQSGISVRMRTNDSIVLADQILQEGHASPADVYLSENSPELMTLQKHGLLGKLSAATLGQVAAGNRSPAGDWIGMALRVNSLVYGPSKIRASQLPASILDLAKPEWKGKVAIAPTDSDFPPLVGAVIAAYGEKAATEWLKGLKRNAAIYQDEEAVVAAVNRGDVASGLINQYYWYRLQLERGKSGIHSTLHYFPNHDVGSITNISGATVLASSKHPQAAEQFVKFLVSKAGQQIIASSDDFEYPARPGVPANSALPPLANIAHATLSVAALGDNQAAPKLMRQVGLY
jgi:iron(III) transport system substrate-binding protein